MSRRKLFRDLKPHFKILGLEPTVDESKVRSRYRELVLEHHPDLGGHPEKFREINIAYYRIIEYIREHNKERRREEWRFLKFLNEIYEKLLFFLDLQLFKVRYSTFLRKTSLEEALKALAHSSSPHLKLLYLRVAVVKGGLLRREYRRKIARALSSKDFPRNRFVLFLMKRLRQA